MTQQTQNANAQNMDTIFNGLGPNIIDEQTKAVLVAAIAEQMQLSRQEGYDSAKAELETTMRNEMAERVEANKQTTVEAIGNKFDAVMTQEVKDVRAKQLELSEAIEAVKSEKETFINGLSKFVTEKLTEFAQRLRAEEKFRLEAIAKSDAKIDEALTNYAKELREDRKQYAQSIVVLNEFVMQKLTEVVRREEMSRQGLEYEFEKIKGMARKQVAEAQAKMEERDAQREAVKNAEIAQLSEYLNNKLTPEIKEFQESRKAYQRGRVKLLSIAESEMQNAKDEAVKKIAMHGAKWIDEKVAEHLTEHAEDIKEAKLNTYGRKVIDTVLFELQGHGLLEGKDTRMLEEKLQTNEVKTNQALSEVVEARKRAEVAEAKVQRMELLDSLLSPLPPSPKKIMEAILESVPTSKLRKTFDEHYVEVMRQSNHNVNESGLSPKSRATSIGLGSDVHTPRNDMIVEEVSGEGSTGSKFVRPGSTNGNANAVNESVDGGTSVEKAINPEIAEVMKITEGLLTFDRPRS